MGQPRTPYHATPLYYCHSRRTTYPEALLVDQPPTGCGGAWACGGRNAGDGVGGGGCCLVVGGMVLGGDACMVVAMQ